MSITEGFLLVVRWLHNIAAITWVGGSLFYFLVLRPASKKEASSWGPLSRTIAMEFKGLVNTSILVLVVTGAIMAFDRLAGGLVGVSYVAALGVKVSLALWMFYIVLSRRRRAIDTVDQNGLSSRPLPQRIGRTLSGYNTVVVLGLLVFLMADLLRFLVERALAGG